MAFTFLQAVNETLKRVGVIHGDAGELTNFVDTARQQNIDVARSIWNEIIHELFTMELFSRGVREGQFVLVTDIREYDLEPDFEIMAADIIRNESETRILTPYQGGYVQLWGDQPDPADFTGQPLYWAINPTSNMIRVDVTPKSSENGDIYKYLYMKRIFLSAVGDTFPFSDTVVDSLIPATAQIWERDRKGRKFFDRQLFRASFNRAVFYLTQSRPRTTYGRHA